MATISVTPIVISIPLPGIRGCRCLHRRVDHHRGLVEEENVLLKFRHIGVAANDIGKAGVFDLIHQIIW